MNTIFEVEKKCFDVIAYIGKPVLYLPSYNFRINCCFFSLCVFPLLLAPYQSCNFCLEFDMTSFMPYL